MKMKSKNSKWIMKQYCPNCHKYTTGGLYSSYGGLDEYGEERDGVLHCGCYYDETGDFSLEEDTAMGFFDNDEVNQYLP